ncbi:MULTISPECIES: hypothetical protein [unclassified Enterococcus]|uniref:phage tail assembly chaperone G n=1 Tax=unclassified Enterococcus TaxID=2608891 RepID=UPI0015576E44|nr:MULTISPECIES: hypothetical protein [unclassified Enterococcus]MBS7578291.1 hypothetical protein [Enterococcus sp. MMGLQ5-2]MBS7585498.1 hypothetical protein [Enterococcus sp. MMGLQ5-1]NPD13355.1 hypothetical protein [Enterococcus sp. MMGLQ5-1]NPD38122.1 hypothetical protein [Enterococcus sp. MMGLQ5-2]
MSEIRLDLRVNGKKKTYTQDFVPYRKALDYTEGEAKLWTQDKDGKEVAPKVTVLERYRVDFVAGLFNDTDLTGDVILDGIDTEEYGQIMDIIYYRVLGYERPVEEVEVDPKGKK